MFKYPLAFINTLCLIVLILCFSIEIPTFSYNFYNYEYEKNNVYETIGISELDLKNVTEKLFSYMKGESGDLVINSYIKGENREFFNEKEKQHMVDVQLLFDIGFTVRKICFIVFLITFFSIFIFSDKKVLDTYLRAWIIGLASFMGMGLFLILFIMGDFNSNFNAFHEMFFSNDLWLLDPNQDLLINIVPLNFFIDIFKAVGAIFLIISFLFVFFSVVALKFRKSKN